MPRRCGASTDCGTWDFGPELQGAAGSDIPFFLWLYGAIRRGRGDLWNRSSVVGFWFVSPVRIGLSTADVYRHRPPHDRSRGTP
jgi:4-diphosphocytidyl-2C-methyl-D-erythritol kinase